MKDIPCTNCEVPTEKAPLCSACDWLYRQAEHPNPSWDAGLKELARCGPTNRRWQFRFYRGEVK